MSQVVDYVFNNMSRIGNDECTYTQNNLLNSAHSSHFIQSLQC